MQFNMTKILNDMNIQFGRDEKDVYAQGIHLARSLGYERPSDMYRLIDEDDQGTAKFSMLEGGRTVTRSYKVVYRDGIIDAAWGSTLPNAKDLRKRIKAILRELDEQGFVLDDERLEDDDKARDNLINQIEDISARASERDGIYSYHKAGGWTRSEMGKMAKKEIKFPGNLRDFNLVLFALGVTVVTGAKCNQWALAPEYFWMADDALVYKRSLGSRVPNTNPHFNAEGKARLFKMVNDFVAERDGVLIK